MLRSGESERRNSFAEREFSFSEIWTVQPRSDSCLAEARQSDRGWTLQTEENELSIKVNELSLRDSPLQSTTFKQHGFIFYAF